MILRSSNGNQTSCTFVLWMAMSLMDLNVSPKEEYLGIGTCHLSFAISSTTLVLWLWGCFYEKTFTQSFNITYRCQGSCHIWFPLSFTMQYLIASVALSRRVECYGSSRNTRMVMGSPSENKLQVFFVVARNAIFRYLSFANCLLQQWCSNVIS